MFGYSFCSKTGMYIQNSNSFLYSPPEDRSLPSQPKSAEVQAVSRSALENFSERAVMTFESMTAGFSSKQREDAARALTSIGKAAAFASMNGFESQEERLVVSQYFGNFSGVLSDDAIKKMIQSKLDNPNFENREFLSNFAAALDAPMQSIDIKV